MTNELTRIDLNVPNVEIDGPALKIGEMDRAAFEELGIKLKAIQGHTVLWWGDWGNAFKEQHGESEVKQVAELLVMGYNYISQCMQTAREYDVLVRTRFLELGLTPSHLLEARYAPSPEFALDRAVEEDWSVRDLRQGIKAMLPAPKDSAPAMFQWIKDPRVIKAQEAFLYIASIIEDLKTTEEDHAVAGILLVEFSLSAENLRDLADD